MAANCWCVKTRLGWCACRDNTPDPADIEFIITECRWVEGKPSEAEFRKPTCPWCLGFLKKLTDGA